MACNRRARIDVCRGACLSTRAYCAHRHPRRSSPRTRGSRSSQLRPSGLWPPHSCCSPWPTRHPRTTVQHRNRLAYDLGECTRRPTTSGCHRWRSGLPHRRIPSRLLPTTGAHSPRLSSTTGVVLAADTEELSGGDGPQPDDPFRRSLRRTRRIYDKDHLHPPECRRVGFRRSGNSRDWHPRNCSGQRTSTGRRSHSAPQARAADRNPGSNSRVLAASLRFSRCARIHAR